MKNSAESKDIVRLCRGLPLQKKTGISHHRLIEACRRHTLRAPLSSVAFAVCSVWPVEGW